MNFLCAICFSLRVWSCVTCLGIKKTQKDKLNGSNYIDWSRNLRIVLKREKKLYVLDAPIPNEPARNATTVQRETCETKNSDSNDVTCLMLATMVHLKEMFQEQARHERFMTTKALTSCRMTPGMPVSTHVLKMKGYLDTLEKLDVQIFKSWPPT